MLSVWYFWFGSFCRCSFMNVFMTRLYCYCFIALIVIYHAQHFHLQNSDCAVSSTSSSHNWFGSTHIKMVNNKLFFTWLFELTSLVKNIFSKDKMFQETPINNALEKHCNLATPISFFLSLRYIFFLGLLHRLQHSSSVKLYGQISFGIWNISKLVSSCQICLGYS